MQASERYPFCCSFDGSAGSTDLKRSVSRGPMHESILNGDLGWAVGPDFYDDALMNPLYRNAFSAISLAMLTNFLALTYSPNTLLMAE